MALLLSNAILHVIDNPAGTITYSNQELDIDSETCYGFISRHAKRLMIHPTAKNATFRHNSRVYALVKAYQQGELHFKDFSIRIGALMSESVFLCKDIPSADILITAFDNAGKRYIAILKLNYGECFTHKLVDDGAHTENHIVKNAYVLPASAGKIEEACLIPYDPMVLRVMEKPYSINGRDTNYFSELFLECDTEISKKETIDIIREVAGEVNAKYYGGDHEMEAKIKCAIIDNAPDSLEDAYMVLDNAVRQAYGDNAEASDEFLTLAKEYGLPHEIKVDKPYVQRTLKTQIFKADNGIEVKLPAELYHDPDTVQFTTNSDGSVTISLKNLRRHNP